jgi:hypothetical protein
MWKARAVAAETQAASEHALRLKMEEDVKRLLLRNMASMNIGALSVFHQHIFPEGDEEERAFFPRPSESATDAMLGLVQSTGLDIIDEPHTHPHALHSNIEETLLLTKVLEMQQAQLKRDIEYSPVKKLEEHLGGVDTAVSSVNGSHYYPLSFRGGDNAQGFAPSSGRSGLSSSGVYSAGEIVGENEETPRTTAPVPLAVNVRPGQQYQHYSSHHNKPWRGGGVASHVVGGKVETAKTRAGKTGSHT